MQEQLATIKERFPCELLSLPQWVAWRYEDDPKRPDKPRKMPKNPNTGGNARSNAPTTWGTFEQAVATAEKQGFSGVGFMFAGQHFGVDVDGCRDPEKGNPEITFSWNGGTTPAQNPHWGEYNFLVEYDGSLYHISLRRQEDGRFYNV